MALVRLGQVQEASRWVDWNPARRIDQFIGPGFCRIRNSWYQSTTFPGSRDVFILLYVTFKTIKQIFTTLKDKRIKIVLSLKLTVPIKKKIQLFTEWYGSMIEMMLKKAVKWSMNVAS